METDGREVRLLTEQGQVGAPLPNLTVATDEATKGEMKRRVLYLSIILAVYVVVNALVQYAFDAAAMETALEQVRRVTGHSRGGHVLPKILISAIPHLLFSIFLGLLVPLCGYLGAKQNSQGLVGCFCGCNALHCACGLCVLLGIVIFTSILSAATPGIETYLERCDPELCSKWPDHYSAEVKRQRTVDCLAAGTWPQYQKLFDGPRYPEICPKIMLKCGGSTTMAPVFDPDLKPFFFRAPGPFDVHGGSDAEPMQNSLQNIFGHPRRLRHHHWDMEGEDLEQMLKEKPMPPNPVADCQPDEKGIKILHEVSVLVPELVPKLVMLMAVRALLLIPVILFGCLGFFWGKDLYSKLSEGYGHLPPQTAPMAPQTQMTLVAPA